MLFIYTLFNLIIAIFSKLKFQKWLNPVGVYCIAWQIAITAHESGLIYYDKMNAVTWVVIMGMQLLFSICCFVAFSGKVVQLCEEKVYDQRSRCLKCIIACTLLSGFAILVNAYYSFSTTGFANLLESTDQRYYERVNGISDDSKIPYLGSLIYVSMSLSGFYTKRYGFTFWIIVNVFLAFVSSLSSGGRAGIVFDALLFAFSFFITTKLPATKKKKDKSKKVKNRIFVFLSLALFITAFVVITNQRVGGVYLDYATPRFYKWFGGDASVYKIVLYLANPIGTLDKFLAAPDFKFGKNTFLTIYNILAKFGVMERPEQYQSWYYTPLPCNVGTWLREIIEDFHLFSIFAVALFGYCSGAAYSSAIRKKTIVGVLISSILVTIISLSFFDWKLRSSGMWIALIIGSILSSRIERIDKKKSQS